MGTRESPFRGMARVPGRAKVRRPVSPPLVSGICGARPFCGMETAGVSSVRV